MSQPSHRRLIPTNSFGSTFVISRRNAVISSPAPRSPATPAQALFPARSRAAQAHGSAPTASASTAPQAPRTPSTPPRLVLPARPCVASHPCQAARGPDDFVIAGHAECLAGRNHAQHQPEDLHGAGPMVHQVTHKHQLATFRRRDLRLPFVLFDRVAELCHEFDQFVIGPNCRSGRATSRPGRAGPKDRDNGFGKEVEFLGERDEGLASFGLYVGCVHDVRWPRASRLRTIVFSRPKASPVAD